MLDLLKDRRKVGLRQRVRQAIQSLQLRRVSKNYGQRGAAKTSFGLAGQNKHRPAPTTEPTCANCCPVRVLMEGDICLGCGIEEEQERMLRHLTNNATG